MSTAVSTPPRSETLIRYVARGAAAALMEHRGLEVCLVGPAGTGKSRACLEKVHLQALKYPGLRGLLTRKTLASLTATGLVTFREKVLHAREDVSFYGGSKAEPAHFRYPNGSRLVVGGLDNPRKVMSSEYDVVYVQEAIDLAEDDWESLTTRLRNGVMPYQQLLADTNPGSAHHWLKARGDAGRTLLLNSRHEDNPAVTPAYLAILDALSGVRKERLRFGRWASAEGMIFSDYDPRVHLLDSLTIGPTWQRWLAVDFGYTNPFVCQWWAEDPDGRLYLYREIYRTQRLVEDHARQIRAYLDKEPRVAGVVCDHDAEDRATLAQCGIETIAAIKDVSPGIQAVADRLRVAGDGKPRLFFLRSAMVGRSPEGKVYGALAEIEGYLWNPAKDGKSAKEEPIKENDHSMDAMRYAIMQIDKPRVPYLVVLDEPYSDREDGW